MVAAQLDKEHIFLFGLPDGRVIDGAHGGGSARWPNHACNANCDAAEDSGRAFIETIPARFNSLRRPRRGSDLANLEFAGAPVGGDVLDRQKQVW
ncbi:hypothetical protein [Paraburkholderia tropica]|uniref:hypothetical protein n=1 Tax=Paraburkholderia tropica TaxID=92647 RepID=UPI003D6D0696